MAKPSRTSTVDLSDFTAWLESLDIPNKPTLHVNGPNFYHAILAVDFGSPLKQTRLSQDVSNELYHRIADATRRVANLQTPPADGRQNVRVSSDLSRGVYWSAIA